MVSDEDGFLGQVCFYFVKEAAFEMVFVLQRFGIGMNFKL